jgi:hypothetical protein
MVLMIFIGRSSITSGLSREACINEKAGKIPAFVGPPGFEPRQTVPKTVVLPLHNGPILTGCKNSPHDKTLQILFTIQIAFFFHVLQSVSFMLYFESKIIFWQQCIPRFNSA